MKASATARAPQRALRATASPGRVRVPRTRAVAPAVSLVAQDDATWSQFAGAVEGEWEGVTAAFGPDGAPQPLPQHYVPDAYREWGVELFDWQSQCSATTGEGRELRSTLRRLMPTVGCEADAVAFTEDATTTASADAGAGATPSEVLAVLPDGSYTVGPGGFDVENASKLRFEACFAAPGLSTEGAPVMAEGAPPPRYRLKVAHNLARNWQDNSWRVASIELHRERYDGPFTGRKELAGCGGGAPAISKLAPMADEQLGGAWVAESGTVLIPGSSGLQPGPAAAAFGSGGGGGEGAVVTRLPLGAWSAVRLAPGGGGVSVEAGAVAGGGRRQVAVREYEDGKLARVAIGLDKSA